MRQLASFIDYLQAIPVAEVTSEKTDLLPEKSRYLIDSIGEDSAGNKVTEVTSKNNEGATEKREFSEFAPVWVAPAPQARGLTSTCYTRCTCRARLQQLRSRNNQTMAWRLHHAMCRLHGPAVPIGPALAPATRGHAGVFGAQ